MNKGLRQLQALVKEKSVAEIAKKAKLSRTAIYYLLRNERSAGKKIRENLYLAFGILAGSWESPEDTVLGAEPATRTSVLKIKEGLRIVEGPCRECVLHDLPGCSSIVDRLVEFKCYTGYALVKIGEWCPATPENMAPGDTVRRVERPDLHFTVVALLKESTTFHSKAVLAPISEPGDDILVDLRSFEVYKEL